MLRVERRTRRTERVERVLESLTAALELDAGDEVEKKRLPESAFQGWSVAKTLHDRLSASTHAFADGDFRATLAKDPKVARLTEATRSDLLRAAGALSQKGRTTLLRLGRAEGFAKLARKVQHALLQTIERTGSDEVASALLRLLGQSSFAGLNERVMLEVVALFRESGWKQGVTVLSRLFELPGFSALDVSNQLDLIRWYRGPVMSESVAPMRKNRFGLAWSACRADLDRFLRGPKLRKASPDLQAELLKDFLYGPSRKVYLMNAISMNGHAVLTLGDPANPKSHSYGLRWVVTEHRTPAPILMSPDPTVQSAWKKSERDAATTYATWQYTVSRHDEARIIGWIEQSYPIADDLRVNVAVARPRPSKTGDFTESVHRIIEMMLAGAHMPERESLYMRSGKPYSPTKDDEALDQMIAGVMRGSKGFVISA